VHLRRSRILRNTAVLAAATTVGAGAGGATYAAFPSRTTKTIVRQVTVESSEPAAARSTLSVNDIYRRTYKGVVEITVSSSQSGPYSNGGPQAQQAQGSGFVYDRNGRIVTNAHVVDGASSISVRFWNGATYEAQVVGNDPSTDIAVIEVGAPSSLLVPLVFGDSDRLLIGDGVIAIGSPFGLEGTVTSGIVSALHRQMSSPNNYAIDDSIQTDAAINHGNSGGPLLNAQGQVIGVNTQIESESGGNDGVGFAVPSKTVEAIVSQLLASGQAVHAYLGVAVDTIPAAVAARLGLVAGVEVAEANPDTPAERAGLRGATGSQNVGGQTYPTGGDVITALDGKRIASAAELRAAINAKRPGDVISVTYWRGGNRHTVDVTLAARPS
jgi:S1-C subfamily serine protease